MKIKEISLLHFVIEAALKQYPSQDVIKVVNLIEEDIHKLLMYLQSSIFEKEDISIVNIASPHNKLQNIILCFIDEKYTVSLHRNINYKILQFIKENIKI